jgi:hypothetical protein
VHAGEHAVGVILADRVWVAAEGERGGDLHLVEETVAQRLLVERDVIAAPHAGDQQIGIDRQDFGDVRREIRRPQLRPGLGNYLDARQELTESEREVLEHVAPIAVIGLQRSDAPHLRPMRRRADRRRDAVGRLDVGHAEGVFRLGHGLVEQEVGAAVVEQREDLQLLGHGTERRGVAARNDARE